MKKTLGILIILLGITNVLFGQIFAVEINGIGPVVKQQRHTESFVSISISIPAEIYLQQGQKEEVLLEAQENILSLIKTEVKDYELKIKFSNRFATLTGDKIRVYITSPEFKHIYLQGSGGIFSNTPIKAKSLDLKVSGSGKILLSDVHTDELEQRISGSGKIKLKGNCFTQSIKISGSGSIINGEMTSKQTNIEISGSGKSTVQVNDYLYTKISGSGRVYFKGNPVNESRITGSGNIYHLQ